MLMKATSQTLITTLLYEGIRASLPNPFSQTFHLSIYASQS